jgi:hypothetical protein
MLTLLCDDRGPYTNDELNVDAHRAGTPDWLVLALSVVLTPGGLAFSHSLNFQRPLWFWEVMPYHPSKFVYIPPPEQE